MKEYISEITQMMKRLDEIRENFTSEGTRDIVRSIVYELKDLRELMDY